MKTQKKNQWKMGYKIANRRTQIGMSQEELAECAGLSRVSVGRIENGEQIPKAQTVEKLCKALGMTINDLYLSESELEQSLEIQIQGLRNSLGKLSIQNQQQFFQMAEVILRGLASDE